VVTGPADYEHHVMPASRRRASMWAMPMINVFATAGTVANQHDPAQQLAAAMMRSEQMPLSRIVHFTKKEISHASLSRLSHQDARSPIFYR
jgi:L-asparaginase/Glu-tRNA(Gln) amidotransferase subunit D